MNRIPFTVRHGWLVSAVLWIGLAAPGPVRAQTRLMEASLSVPRSLLYVGETFDLTLSLHSTGVRLGQTFQLQNLPTDDVLQRTTDFQDLPIAREQVGAQIRETRRFRCRARFLKPGAMRLKPIFHVGILSRTESFFGARWTESMREVQPDALVLEVVPLPEAGRPEHFSGAVGTCRFELNVAPTNVAVGDLVTMTMRVKSDGYLDEITPPALASSKHFKAYSPRIVESRDAGERIFEQIVIPQTTNAVLVPPVTFTYFDPHSGRGRYVSVNKGPTPLSFHAVERSIVPLYRPEEGQAGEHAPTVLPALPLKHLVFPDPESQRRVEQTRQAFDDGYFDAAAEACARLPQEEDNHAAVLYNLGTIYLQARRYGPAILNLRRALQLAPHDRSIKQNLDLALRVAVPGHALPVGRLPLWSWARLLLASFLAAGAVLSLGHSILRPRHRWVWQSSAGVLLLAATLLFLAQTRSTRLAATEAIVMEAVAARLAPSPSALATFDLPEGASVHIQETYRNWACVAAGHNRGWVPLSRTERLIAP